MSSDTIERLNAALEGRYHIERELGEGGMATVYLARDEKHHRRVALKVLKPELAAVVGAERFLAEIETTANLQHPHILPLFDSGEADSFLFYVMPFVEGESLRERLDREHQLPVDEAVRIASDVAEALQAAHDQGVIHRDVKPANILLSKGRPLVSDFGIALALGAAGAGRLTETGLSLGTPHYMSPEQATGDSSVGPATDTYALGCVLYEMLVGEPPHTGGTPQAVLGKIITEPPPQVTRQRKAVPKNVEAVIGKALEKVPADRFISAQDFANALANSGFRYGETAAGIGPAAFKRWRRLAISGWSFALLLALAFGWTMLRPEAPATPQRVQRFVSPFGEGQEPIRITADGTAGFDLSPEGSGFVYRGRAPESQLDQLWVRRWNDLNPALLRGTDGGVQPSLSPDGQEVAFFQGGEIKVVPTAGGPTRTLMAGRAPRWGSDGYVYATVDSGTARVPAIGGVVDAVTMLSGDDVLHESVNVLPGGQVALFVAGVLEGATLRYEIRLVRLETGESEPLTPGRFPRYARSGHLTYLLDGTLMASGFDSDTGELVGPPVALVEDVLFFSLADNGTLLYTRGISGARTEFVWVTRSGQETPVDPGFTFQRESSGNWAMSLSPGGTRVAFNQADGDVWIKHLPDGPLDRLTSSPEFDFRPIWTPDGQWVTYFTVGDTVWSKRADGTGERQLVLASQVRFSEGSWSPDGVWLALRQMAGSAELGLRNIFAFRPGVDSDAVPLIADTEFAENQPTISPDGRWLAYDSDETGRREVFVRPFPNVDSAKVPVSTEGGGAPDWANSGQELFFVDGNRSMVVAQFDPVSGRVLGRETLFTLGPSYFVNWWDTSPDGQRFLMARDLQDEVSSFVLVQNFFEELRRLLPN